MTTDPKSSTAGDDSETDDHESPHRPMVRRITWLLSFGVVMTAEYTVTSPLGWILPAMLVGLLAYRWHRWLTVDQPFRKDLDLTTGGLYMPIGFATFVFQQIDLVRTWWQTGSQTALVQDLLLAQVDFFVAAATWPIFWLNRQPIMVLALSASSFGCWLFGLWLVEAYRTSEPPVLRT